MIEKSANLLASERPREPLHVVLDEHLHGAALERAGALDRSVHTALDRHVGARARDAVACAGHDVIENLRERPEYWDGEHVAIGDFDFAVALHETRVAAEPGEIVAPAERTLGGLVAVVEIG